jgi:hypothetical protein
MYIDHYALRYPINKPILGGRICKWLLFLQEYDFDLVLKPGKINVGSDHLSCILSGEEAGNLDEILLDAQLFLVKMVDDYFVDIIQFLSTGMPPSDMIFVQKM